MRLDQSSALPRQLPAIRCHHTIVMEYVAQTPQRLGIGKQAVLGDENNYVTSIQKTDAEVSSSAVIELLASDTNAPDRIVSGKRLDGVITG
ncbi:MAG: hypothetical protein Kow0096_13100 [Thiohalomonadaceae bacterium]